MAIIKLNIPPHIEEKFSSFSDKYLSEDPSAHIFTYELVDSFSRYIGAVSSNLSDRFVVGILDKVYGNKIWNISKETIIDGEKKRRRGFSGLSFNRELFDKDFS